MSNTESSYLTLVFKPTSPEQRREILNSHDWTAASNDHVIWERDTLQAQLSLLKEVIKAVKNSHLAESLLLNTLKNLADDFTNDNFVTANAATTINNALTEYYQLTTKA